MLVAERRVAVTTAPVGTSRKIGQDDQKRKTCNASEIRNARTRVPGNVEVGKVSGLC